MTRDDCEVIDDKPEDITPPMAREREYSDKLLAALYASLETAGAFRELAILKTGSNIKQHTFTAEDQAAWRLLYDGGMKVKDIADHFDISTSAIYKFLKPGRAKQ
jgi:hypothetical protein